MMLSMDLGPQGLKKAIKYFSYFNVHKDAVNYY